ncbi:MAG: hypothetical protein KDA45_08805, partial [Planctomycetales bacterium]|nr:hypothetical protein [Planctomycetales bacterium]
MLLHLLIGILAAIGGLVVLAILALTIAYFIVARQLSLKLQGTVEQMQALLADSIEANGEREDARGSTYDSVPPMRIQLKPLESGLWRTEPLGARVDAWLREHSFSAVGDFRVLEIDQEVLRVYLSDDRRLLAALRYQADSPQPYVEFCFDLGHGTRGGISNPPGSPIELPPEAVGKYFRGGLNDDFSLLSRMWLEAKELVDEHTVYAIDAEQIAAFFEEAHAAQMDFQLARGGVSEAEIRAAFTAQGIEPSDDDIAHIQQQWQLAIEQRLLELSHRGQRQ